MPNETTALALDALLEVETADDLAAYRTMLLIRRFEEKLGLLIALGILSETAAFATGKEAVAAAIGATRHPGEVLVSATATYGVQLAAGQSPEHILTRMISGQRQEQGALGVWQCDGSRSALETAAEHASAGRATLCWIEPQPRHDLFVTEFVIRIAQQRLPVVCIAEFLSDGSDDPVRDHGLVLTLESLGVHVHTVDGLDARRMRVLCQEAWDAVRSGGGPVVVCATTCRFQGHVAAQSRPAGSKDRLREDTDPLVRARTRLLSSGAASEGELKAIERAVRDGINGAAAAARIVCQAADECG